MIFNKLFKVLKKTIIIVVCLFAKDLYSQQGTSSNPFTSLSSANSVTTSGTYYFNISGTTFDTYIESGGWILVATDQGSSSATNLPQTSSLNQTTRGILNSSTLALFTKMNQVRIQTSNGQIDASTTNDTVISRVKTFRTISRGVSDKSYNLSWSGTGANLLNTNSTNCNTTATTGLNATIYHPCGDPNAFHWLPILNFHTTTNTGTQMSNTVYFYLWVKVAASSLPVTWGEIKIDTKENGNLLSWETFSEKNTREFEVEFSNNAIDFNKVGESINAAGNSYEKKQYDFFHRITNNSNLYYRIKQIDNDLKYEYSPIVFAKSKKTKNILEAKVYPKMISKDQSLFVEISNEQEETIYITLYDLMGNKVMENKYENSPINFITTFKTPNTSSGIYFLQISSTQKKIVEKIVLIE